MRTHGVVAMLLLLAACDGLGGPRPRVEEVAHGPPPHVGEIDRHVALPATGIARFTPRGAQITLGAHAVTICAVEIGREGAKLRELDRSASPTIEDGEVRTERGDGIVEWWRALAAGLEHGITLAERPRGAGDLVIEIDAPGDLALRSVSDDSLTLVDAHGVPVATYAQLVVLDAAGARVPARMSARSGRIALTIDDAAARYPLVVDPLLRGVEEGLLVASDGAPDDQFGRAVALSDDGARAIVGAGADDRPAGSDVGSARVFVRTGTSWTEEALLLAAVPQVGARFGGAVALSADGTRAIVGVANSAHIFLRTGSVWAEETRLVPSYAGATRFGFSVAISGDGTRAIVGDIDHQISGIFAGSARVFVRTGTVWTEEAGLVAPSPLSFERVGWAVDLSADGSRALVGAEGAGARLGSAYVFLRAGTSWSRETQLLAAGAVAIDHVGTSVSLSADGSRAVIGAHQDDFASGTRGTGRAHVFARTGTSWSEEARLVAVTGVAGDGLGTSVALSSDGMRALLGGPANGNRRGSGRLFVRFGTSWSEEATLVAPAVDGLGVSAALSSDGGRALLGAYDYLVAGDIGSAHVFTLVPADADGTACTTGASCTSGYCVDGVCCETACGGAATSDCQACAASLTGGVNGNCGPLAAMVAGTVICRAASDVCDLEERCSAASAACPADDLQPTTSVCRPLGTAGPCDSAAETCTAASAACPPDVVAVAGTICRPSAGACDTAEACDGAGFACPAADGRVAAGVVCRSSMGDCDLGEQCDGSSAACPPDAFRPADFVCRPSAGPCDIEDLCPGTGPACPSAMAMAGVVCAMSSAGVCDAADVCTGSSANCPPLYLSGVECRPAVGACDATEVCAGSAPNCPPDTLLAAGIVCRASVDLACDPLESCDGVATACPSDVITCAPDAGVGSDAGGSRTDAASADAGTTPAPATGCACRAATGTPASPHGITLAIVLILVRRGPRSRRAEGSSTSARSMARPGRC